MAKKVIQFNDQNTYDYTMYEGEKGNRVSMTIQGQDLSVSEILAKFSTGTLPEIGKNGTYNENQDFDDIDETRRPDFDYPDVQYLKDSIEKSEMEIEERQRIKTLTEVNEKIKQENADMEALLKANQIAYYANEVKKSKKQSE